MQSTSARDSPVHRGEVLAIVLLTAAAAAVRLVDLGSLPPGLHVDEAFNILDARAVMSGWRPVFLPANAGREALFTYWQALLFTAAGESTVTARLASALLGIATIPAAWALTRSLGMPGAPRVALYTAALTAFSYWHLHFSRFGIRAIAFPLVVTATLWAWWQIAAPHAPARSGGRHPEPSAELANRAVGAGKTAQGDAPPPVGQSDPGSAGAPRRYVLVLAILLGMAVYTHPVGRVLWLVPLTHAGLVAWRDRDRRPLRSILAAMLGAAALALPVVVVWLRQPWLFLGHARETSVLGSGPAAVAVNLTKVLGMFNLAGDPAPWRNLSGRPVFDPVAGLLFLAGLLLVMRSAARGTRWASLALVWFGLLLVPTVVTDTAPNFSRAIGVLPIVTLFPGLAVDRLHVAATKSGHPVLASSALALALAFSTFSTLDGYFNSWSRHPDTPFAFDADKAVLAEMVNRLTAGGAAVYLSPTMAEHPTVRVLSQGRPRGFSPQIGLVLPPGRYPTAAFVYTPAEGERVAELWSRLREADTDATGDTAQPSRADSLVRPEMLTIELEMFGQLWLEAYTAVPWGMDVHRALRQPSAPARVGTPGPAGPRPGPARAGAAAPPAPTARFGDYMDLLSVTLPKAQEEVRAGDTATLTLRWLARRPTPKDMNLALHLVATEGTTIAQGDGPPLGGTYSTDQWRPGELVYDVRAITVPANAPLGTAEIRVGWYDWRTMEPLATRDDETLVTAATLAIVP